MFAGDIAETPRVAVETLAAAPALSGRPVVYVPGNHELFSGDIDVAIADGRAAAEGTNVRLLDREVDVVAGARFVSAMLWTDYAIGGDPKRAMQAAADGMYDHRLIRSGDRVFSPGDAIARHQGDIETSLAEPFAGRPASALRPCEIRRKRPERGVRLGPVGSNRARAPGLLGPRTLPCVVGLSGRRHPRGLQP
ncbi:hypothetical protein [Methylosinus sp. RM1]|uniref:hypothetical protein n=1 Tax=Methylosinus sp. RM1 TaxID=2583817 RepID=UPI00140BD025|nr:hypothetical protein [Methylosinus sp. RM1]